MNQPLSVLSSLLQQVESEKDPYEQFRLLLDSSEKLVPTYRPQVSRQSSAGLHHFSFSRQH